jgi:hypothetical protein
MFTQMHPQEIYLLERYTSLDYFGELRDTWGEMVAHLESCLNSFMRDLSPRYRSSPLPEQPDIVWGHKVIPNFRDTLQGLHKGFIMLSHGDVAGLTYAAGPRSDFKGQMDYSTDWMQDKDKDRYEALLDKAVAMAHCIVLTEGAYWDPTNLLNYSDAFGPLNPPQQWPTYRVNRNIWVSSGSQTRQSGIYVPDVKNSCPEFLSTNYAAAPQASVLLDVRDLLAPDTGEKYGEELICEKRSCNWYLIERTPNQDGVSDPPGHETAHHLRIPGGETCPVSGFYFTPARPRSRRAFEVGEVMPAFDTTYGTTIWQWDDDQG